MAWNTNILESYGLIKEIEWKKGAEEYIKFLKIMKRLALKVRSLRHDEE